MRENFAFTPTAISRRLFTGVPKGLRFIFSSNGVTMFMRSIANDTPSFIVPNFLIMTVSSPSPTPYMTTATGVFGEVA